MTDIAGQKASSFAIVEKRPQRPGGFVGICFQLLDWNRRLAKKKLFSKKFLPPVHLRKPSKKFGGDEKQPQHRLIVDENTGGFPHVKKNDGACNVDAENKNEMRAPGLVARLMGLESMPAVSHDKSKTASLSGAGCDDGEKILDGHGRLEQEDHEYLVSPVKNPRSVSGRNASRLICAATRILEPGLNRNISKCALPYSNAADHPLTTKALMEEAIDLKPLEKSNFFQISAEPLNILQSSSSRNCCHLLEVADVGPSKEEQLPVFSSVSQFVNPSCKVSERGIRKHHIFYPELGKRKSKENAQLHAAFVTEDRQRCAYYMSDKKLLNRAGQRQWPATSLQSTIPKDVSPFCSGHETGGQNQMFKVRESLPSGSKVSGLKDDGVSSVANAANEGNNFVLLNRNLSYHPRLRRSAKEDSNRLDKVGRIGEMREDSLSSVRRRISTNSSRQKEHLTFVSSFAKPTTVRSNTISRKDCGCASHSPIEPCSNNILANLQESINANSVRNYSDVISCTFKFPMKHKTGIHVDVEARINQNGPDGENTLKKSAFNENDGKRSHLKSFPLSGDSGALLDQKLKELTYQEEDDSTFVDTAPKKSTATIVQELMSAWKTERPCHWDVLAYCVEQSPENRTLNSQAKPRSTKNSIAYLPYYEHLSPGSVLEASFSNDSRASSRQDGGSGCNLGVESTECCERPYLLEPDTDLLDSASSLSIGELYRELVTNLLNSISELFNTTDLAGIHLKGSKLTHAKEVILNAELVFGNAALPDALASGGFSISHFIVNELETLASVMRTNFSGLVAFETKKENQIKGFIFDCVIEYLESRFSRYSSSGFGTLSILPLRMKSEMLISEIIEEVGRWAELAELITDELIEHDMGHSSGKWTDFERETFQTGIEIDLQILQTLITEIVVDLTDCKPLCCC